MKKRIIGLVVVLMLAVGSLSMILGDREIYDVETTVPMMQKIKVFSESVGELRPRNTSTLIAEKAGVVEKVFFNEGDVIESGNVIASVINETEDDALAVYSMQETMSTADPAADIIGAAQIYGCDIDVWNSILAAEGEETVNETSAEKPESSSYIKSDSKGTVLSVLAKNGDIVTPMQPVALVADLEDMVVETYVQETEFLKLEEGMAAIVEINGCETEATVTELSDSLEQKQTYSGSEKVGKVILDIKDDMEYLMGSTANVKIVTTETDEVLTIPIKALADKNSVYVINEEGIAEKRELTLGATDSKYAEVIDGLKEGEEIVLDPPEELHEGADVI